MGRVEREKWGGKGRREEDGRKVARRESDVYYVLANCRATVYRV